MIVQYNYKKKTGSCEKKIWNKYCGKKIWEKKLFLKKFKKTIKQNLEKNNFEKNVKKKIFRNKNISTHRKSRCWKPLQTVEPRANHDCHNGETD